MSRGSKKNRSKLLPPLKTVQICTILVGYSFNCSFAQSSENNLDTPTDGPLFADMPAPPPEFSVDAVSAPNGRIYGGGLGVSIPSYHTGYVYSGGSWAFPLSHSLGFQTELLAGANNKNSTLLGSGVHLFWRNPHFAALGLYAGAAHNNGVSYQRPMLRVGQSVIKGGVEGAWYVNSFLTLEGIIGHNWYSFHTVDHPNSSIFGDVRLVGYAKSNTQLYVGYGHANHANQIELGGQHQFYTSATNSAVFYLEGSRGEHDTNSITAGFRFQLGGDDKPLVRHDREDYLPIYSTLLSMDSATGLTGPSGAPGANGISLCNACTESSGVTD